MIRWIAVLLFVVAAQARHEQYEGHALYRVTGPSDQFQYLEAYIDILSATPAAISASRKLEALIRLSPEESNKWLQYFDDHHMSYKLVSNDLAQILRTEDSNMLRSRADNDEKNNTMSWDIYYNTEEIYKYIEGLAAKYPNLVTVVNAGLSYEGRQIKYVKVSTTNFENRQKQVILIDAAIHAREWVTPPVALYLLTQLVEGTDRTLTDNLDWIIIPVVNIDGYEYSINEDRLWRKTRSKAHDGADECPGVDGNRNYDFEWGTREASRDPCSAIYEGPSVFSEPETRIVRDAIAPYLERTKLYISLHNHGNLIIYSWGNNGTLPSNGLSLHRAGIEMAVAIDALKLEKAKPYMVGNAANVLYFSSGTSNDWGRAIGIPLAYTMELPGYEYDFVVPDTYIRQIVTESFAGLAAGARFVLSQYG